MKDLALQLYDVGAVQFGSFTLKSGITSPIYIDLRVVVSYPDLLRNIANRMWDRVSEILDPDLICGVPYTALPIATAISLEHNIPMVMRRKEVKEYGTKKTVEGVFKPGQSCLVIEDLVTSGQSSLETINSLESVALRVNDVVVLIDREQGGKKILEQKGYHLHSVFALTSLLEILEEADRLDDKTVKDIKTFIDKNQIQSPVEI